jgi:hypothetical protein
VPIACLPGRVALARAVVIAIAVLAAASPHAHAATALTAGTSRIAAKVRPGHSVTATVRLSAAAASVELRLRAVPCSSAPTVKLRIDGQTITSRRVASRRYVTVSAPAVVSAGAHRLVLSARGSAPGRCRPTVIVDAVRFHVGQGTGATTTAPAAASQPSVPTSDPKSGEDPAAQDVDAPPSTDDPPSGGEADGAPTSDPGPSAPSADPAPSDPAPVDPAPAGPAPAPARPTLRWAPPVLTAPTTIAVGQGDKTFNLDMTKDYVIDLGPTTHVGTVKIVGGHNVVMIGGRIALTPLSASPLALGIKGSTGTVHVEGIEFDGTSGREMDAISIQAPLATVQVENVRADGLLGTFNTNHSDVIQPWGGVARLRVDRLTADSNYQGIFTRPDQGAIGSVALQNVDMTFNNVAATSAGGYLLWMTTGCDMAPTTLSDVYIAPRKGKTLASAVWPTTSDASCPAKLAGNKATWPNLPVTGAVTGGAPSGGSFVPAGSVGVGYISPGYQ